MTLREERRLRVFENRVLRKIFGPRWDKVTGEWRKLHNRGLASPVCCSGRHPSLLPKRTPYSQTTHR